MSPEKMLPKKMSPEKMAPKKTLDKDRQLTTPSPKNLLALPPKQALDVIMDSLTPAYLIQSLAPEDFFLLIHEIGHEDALPLLARASNDQWQFIWDVELWEKDQLSNDAVNRWLQRLMKADPERLVTWSVTEQLDLISLHMCRNIDVRIMEHDESLSDFDDSFFTFDGQFYIRFKNNKSEEPLKDYLYRLAELDVGLFHDLLLHFNDPLPSEVEENLFRIRNTRMAESGFLPFHEALAIYQPLSPDQLIKKMQVPEKRLIPDDSMHPQVVPVSKTLLLGEDGPFYQVLRHDMDWDTLERIQREFAGMCNQIMSADNHIARSKEQLAAVVRKACGYLDVGLEMLGGRSLDTWAGLVKQFPLFQIFRAGYGGAITLKWRAQRWFKESWFNKRGLAFDFWEEPWGGTLEGFLLKHPLFFVGVSKEGTPYREFRRLEEITNSRTTLDRIIAVDNLFSLLLPRTTELGKTKTFQPLTYKNLLLTCWMRDAMGLTGDLSPVTVNEWSSFFPTLWTEGATQRSIKESVRRSLFLWLCRKTDRSENDIPSPEKDVVHSLFDELENDYGAVSTGNLDPRYVTHFLVAVQQHGDG